jgi:phospholipid/cholesterol/gamma-HCH transport system ATP-binding protein
MKKASQKEVFPKLIISDLHKYFGNKKVLDGVNLDVYNNESLVIFGGSGSGKSVLIKAIVGLVSADSGKVEFDGSDITHLSRHSRDHLMSRFGFLFQGGALFDSLTVWENIAFYLLHNRYISRRAARELSERKLNEVGLAPDVMDLYPSELSGGMQKRVALARAIANDPEVIFFDEPTTGLDPIMANVINNLIQKVRTDLKATTITITHDIESAKQIGTRAAMLYKGQIIWNGKITEIYNSKNPIFDQFINGKIKGPISVGDK